MSYSAKIEYKNNCYQTDTTLSQTLTFLQQQQALTGDMYQTYLWAIESFKEYIQVNKIQPSIDSISPEHCKTWLEFLQNDNQSLETVAMKIIVMTSFFTILEDQCMVESNPFFECYKQLERLLN
jgi:site-specific recombinase XerD